jgi:hypothetical protein
MTVWITKYALSWGILCVEDAIDVGDDMLKCPSIDPYTYFHTEGKDWHRDEASAKVRAEEMRIAKIASLKKQLTKLEKMTF